MPGALGWVVATPFLTVPYFLAVTLLTAEPVGPDSAYLTEPLSLAYVSISALIYTGPVIGIASVVVMPYLKPYLNGFWRVMLFAVVAGWLHCTAFIVLTASGTLVGYY